MVAERGRPRVSDSQTAVRLPDSFLKRADVLLARITKQDPAALGFSRASRSTILRIVIDLGLTQLEARYPRR
ncbi:MAG: hypothetical protein ABI629_07885 [bacterium]